jgi:hypothetical protein
MILPDGSSLLVRLVKPAWWSVGRHRQLLVERDGMPLPGSDGHPLAVGRRAGRLILFLVVLRVLFFMLWRLFDQQGRSGGGSVGVFGALLPLETPILLVLGIAALFGRRLPVALAAGLFALEAFALLVASGGVPNPFGLLIQVLVTVELVRAWREMAPRQRVPSLASVFE